MQSKKPLFDGLADLARSNQHNRDAALLRATTELFVRDLKHDSDQIRRYEELASHCLPKVSAGDRAYVADRLAICVDAPQSVVRMLARDVIEVAAPIIRRSPVLDPHDLLAVMAATGVEHHRLIVRRPALSDRVVRALRLTGDAEILANLDGGSGLHTGADEDRADKRPAATVSALHLRPSHSPRDDRDAARFLELDRPQRLRVLADIATRPQAPSQVGSASRLDRAFRSILGAAKIVGYARSKQPDQLIAAIAEGLDIDSDHVSACLADRGGEALAVLLKALHLDDAQAQQVFLLATPAGTDTTLFFPLTDLYSGMEPSTAESLCEQWRVAGRPRAPHHQPFLADGDQARRPAREPAKESSKAGTKQSKRA